MSASNTLPETAHYVTADLRGTHYAAIYEVTDDGEAIILTAVCAEAAGSGRLRFLTEAEIPSGAERALLAAAAEELGMDFCPWCGSFRCFCPNYRTACERGDCLHERC